MRATLMILALLLAPAATANSGPAPAPGAKLEKALRKKYPKLFQRKGNLLELHLAGKAGVKSFRDVPEEGERYAENYLIAFYPKLEVALVQTYFNDGGDYTLVALRSGKEAKVAEKPLWNSAGDLFVSVNEGEYADGKRGLQLGYCRKHECSVVHELDGRFSEASWLTRDRLTAINRIPAADGGPGLVVKVRCTFRRKSESAVCIP